MTSNHTCKYEGKGTYARSYQKVHHKNIHFFLAVRHTRCVRHRSIMSTYGGEGWRAFEAG